MNSQGDSGGPLFQYDAEDNPVLVGVVSASVPRCADIFYPTIHVRTSSYNDFFPSDSGIQRTQSAVQVRLEEAGTFEATPQRNSIRLSTLSVTLLGCLCGVALLIVVFVVSTAVFRFRNRERNSDSMPPSVSAQSAAADAHTAPLSGDASLPGATPPWNQPVTDAMFAQTLDPAVHDSDARMRDIAVVPGEAAVDPGYMLDDYDPYEAIQHFPATADAPSVSTEGGTSDTKVKDLAHTDNGSAEVKAHEAGVRQSSEGNESTK